MIYSVYRYGARTYDYYEAPGKDETHAGAPPIRSHKPIGATLEQASWVVPPGARRVGSGELPRGRIAVLPGAALGSYVESGSFAKVAILGGLLWLTWRHIR